MNAVEFIFYNRIMSSPQNRDKLNFLGNQDKIYDFFCENGYNKNFDVFKVELKDFLNSDGTVKMIFDYDDSELSDEMLDQVAGGGANPKRVIIGGLSALLLACGGLSMVNTWDTNKNAQIESGASLDPKNDGAKPGQDSGFEFNRDDGKREDEVDKKRRLPGPGDGGDGGGGGPAGPARGRKKDAFGRLADGGRSPGGGGGSDFGHFRRGRFE